MSEVGETNRSMSTLLFHNTPAALGQIKVHVLVSQSIIKATELTVTLADTTMSDGHAKLVIQCFAQCKLLLMLDNSIFKAA